ncbi:MAG: hypothetical protein RR060_05705 [Victivallaceae bacterium]
MTCNDIKRNKKWLLLWLIPLFFSIFTSLNGYFWVINFIMGFSSIFGLAFIISFIVLSLVEFNWLDCLDLIVCGNHIIDRRRGVEINQPQFIRSNACRISWSIGGSKPYCRNYQKRFKIFFEIYKHFPAFYLPAGT